MARFAFSVLLLCGLVGCSGQMLSEEKTADAAADDSTSPGPDHGGPVAVVDAATCDWKGKIYDVGAQFPAFDGCNTCWCSEDVRVWCTLAGCGGCAYGGKRYSVGQIFPTRDGCNSCECDSYYDNTYACTGLDCPCEPTSEWYRKYLSPTACDSADYACPTHTARFVNECGCGCEQDPICPEVLDCGDGCLVAPEACPYSAPP